MTLRTMSVGLPKKNEDNDLEEYKGLGLGEAIMIGPGVVTPGGIGQVVQYRIEQMQQHPENFFNFGFTYNDFKAYLMKLTYCRAMRKFVERKRIERIEQFQKNNQMKFGELGYEHEFDPMHQ